MHRTKVILSSRLNRDGSAKRSTIPLTGNLICIKPSRAFVHQKCETTSAGVQITCTYIAGGAANMSFVSGENVIAMKDGHEIAGFDRWIIGWWPREHILDNTCQYTMGCELICNFITCRVIW